MPPEKCENASAIESLKQRDDLIMEFIKEIRGDIKVIKDAQALSMSLQQAHEYHKESMARAFGRIEKLEEFQKTTSAIMNQMEGMRKLAWLLWISLAGGLGVVILKVFNLIGMGG